MPFGFGRGRGWGRGPGGFCVCPACGMRVPHQRGIPCSTVRCPNCGTLMMREGGGMGMGRAIAVPRVDTDKCTGCGICEQNCPTGAIRVVEGKAVINSSLCTGCGNCIRVCPVGAVK